MKSVVDEPYEIEEVEEVWFTDPEGNPVLVDPTRDVRLEGALFQVPVKDPKRRVVHGKPDQVLELCSKYGLNIRSTSGVYGVSRRSS